MGHGSTVLHSHTFAIPFRNYLVLPQPLKFFQTSNHNYSLRVPRLSYTFPVRPVVLLSLPAPLPTLPPSYLPLIPNSPPTLSQSRTCPIPQVSPHFSTVFSKSSSPAYRSHLLPSTPQNSPLTFNL